MIEVNQATYNFIKKHLNDEITKLLFQKDHFPNVDMDFAAQQIAGYKKAIRKIPTLAKDEHFLYPKSISLEQCSSEYTARYKANLLKHKKVADITGGFGIDSFFISEKAKEVFYIEYNTELFEIADHNFKLYNKTNIHSFCGDGLSFLQENKIPQFDCIYLDPSRRNNNKQKVLFLEDSSPNILECKDLLLSKANTILLKVSPMLDISKSLKDLNGVREVHIIAVDNECKELLFICERRKEQRIKLICVNISSINEKSEFSVYTDEEASIDISYALNLKKYLYEPNSAILKAGVFKSVAKQFALEKLQVSSHLYTSDKLIQDFPGRIFNIENYFTPDEKNLKNYLPEMGANVVTRNYPLSVDKIRKKYKLMDGGDYFIFATTLQNNQKIMILCKRYK